MFLKRPCCNSRTHPQSSQSRGRPDCSREHSAKIVASCNGTMLSSRCLLASLSLLDKVDSGQATSLVTRRLLVSLEYRTDEECRRRVLQMFKEFARTWTRSIAVGLYGEAHADHVPIFFEKMQDFFRQAQEGWPRIQASLVDPSEASIVVGLQLSQKAACEKVVELANGTPRFGTWWAFLGAATQMSPHLEGKPPPQKPRPNSAFNI